MTIDPAPYPKRKDELNPDPKGVTTFARMEGLIDEEAALLLIPGRERSREQRERLTIVGRELDRLSQMLRERAARLEHRSVQ
jgi:hypothetical protein